MLAWQAYQSGLQGPLGGAAAAETYRRLLVTTLALERFHLRHHSYPANLNQLVPSFLDLLPFDFMDGKPLRYRRTEDGHFVLYSVGLDGVDNGGKVKVPDRPFSQFGRQEGFDLVWPRPASPEEVEKLHSQERQTLFELQTSAEEAEANEWWQHTARRQAKLETILKRPIPSPKPVRYQGQPLERILCNEAMLGTNQSSLTQLLSLTNIVTGLEPEVVTFELPIRFDALTNIGTLQLYIDPVEDEDSDEGCAVGQVECSRTTNGNCLLAWNTIYESPGKHALLAGLELNDDSNSDEEIVGPMIVCEVTNLCQFTPSSAHFERENGVTLRARLGESEGICIVDFYSPEGKLLNTSTQKARDHAVAIRWDLQDQQGHACTNDAFNTVVHVTLTGSGRSQALKGP